MSKVTALEHHGTVAESILRTEGWRKREVGEQPKTSLQLATEYYEGQRRNGAAHYQRAFTDPQRDACFINNMAAVIEAERNGELETVRDFSQKRDLICDACPVAVRDCWRRNDDISIREAIEMLRG